jgi:YD repeat-containing protein
MAASPAGPPAALCRKTVQATTDASGSQGLGATVTGTPRTWNYTYNSSGQVLTVNGPRTDVSDITTYSYYTADSATGLYRRGDLKDVKNALNHTTQFTVYDAHGRPKTLIDPNGLTTQLTYWPRGWLKSRTVGSEVTNYAYDGVGNLTKITLPDGSFLTYAYNAAHQLTDLEDNLGHTIHYTLDLMGNRTGEEVFDPQGTLKQTQGFVFDALNRLQQTLGANPGEVTSFGYDDQGNLQTVTDALSHATTHAYDALNPQPSGEHYRRGAWGYRLRL